jgi:hypothetical protein
MAVGRRHLVALRVVLSYKIQNTKLNTSHKLMSLLATVAD